MHPALAVRSFDAATFGRRFCRKFPMLELPDMFCVALTRVLDFSASDSQDLGGRCACTVQTRCSAAPSLCK